MAGQDGAGRQHAYTGPAGPQVEEPTYAEKVRTLMAGATTGMLATMSKKVAGYPFGSLMPFALDGAGRPVFLISNMAMHTQNLKAEARASLFCSQGAVDGEVLGAARVTLVGDVRPVDGGEVRESYLARHPNAANWVDFADFGFFRLEPVEIYFVGGFGVMGWVPAGEYRVAEADPLAGAAAGIMMHMNADHVEAMIALARTYAGHDATAAAMTSVDRLGFWMKLTTAAGMKGARVNFLREVRTVGEARAVLVEMVRGAA